MTTVRLPQTGGCACGAIRYELTALPWTSYLCHCSECRRQSGTAYGITTFVPREAIRMTRGEPATWAKVNSEGGISAIRFCGVCASRLWTEREGAGHRSLRPGTLDDSTWLPQVAQMWTANALPWALLDGVLSYEGDPDGYAAMLAAFAALGLQAATGPPAG